MKKSVTEKYAKQLSDSWHNTEYNTHSLHSLAPYTGSFPPDLATYFVQQFSSGSDTVYDPFSGCGTTALVAANAGRDAIASDSFMYAGVLTRAKLNPIGRPRFKSYIEDVFDDATKLNGTTVPDPLDEEPDLEVFFSPATRDTLARVRTVLRQRPPSPDKDMLDAVMCGILHGPSSHHLSVQTKDLFPMGTKYVKEYADEHGLEKPDKDIKQCLLDKYDYVTTDGVPQNTGRFEQSFSRDVPIETNSVDLVVTSPPYLDLVNYSWNNWIRLWWLRADYEAERNNVTTTSSVSKYKAFIENTVAELERVVKTGGTVVSVSGNVKKHRTDTTIRTYSLIATIADNHGFDVETVIWDNYGASNKTTYSVFNKSKLDTDAANDSLDACLILQKK